jgi:hypothetical protein
MAIPGRRLSGISRKIFLVIILFLVLSFSLHTERKRMIKTTSKHHP